MTGTGLIGYGLAGSAFHAPLIAATDGLDLVAVASSQAEAVHARHPAARIHAGAEALIADPAVELVVIATPNPLHAPLARAALNAGKHVVVDKPFVADTADGPALIALAAERERTLGVFHNRRWDSDFLTVRRLIDEDQLGRLSLVEMHWDRFRPAIKTGWRERPGAASGLLADLGPHLVDQTLCLFGAPDAVAADILIQRADAEVDDAFRLTLHYGDLRVALAASSLVVAPRPRFALHGERGSFVKYGIDPQEAVLRAGGTPADPGFGVETPDLYGVLTDADGRAGPVASERGDWRAFYAGVARAIRDGAPAPVPAAEALAVLRLIDAARRSAADGRVLAAR